VNNVLDLPVLARAMVHFLLRLLLQGCLLRHYFLGKIQVGISQVMLLFLWIMAAIVFSVTFLVFFVGSKEVAEQQLIQVLVVVDVCI